MKEIRFTLYGEGNSDRALLPILRWLLTEHYSDYAVQSAWANPNLLGVKSMAARIRKSIELYPCELLFVHRDGDNATIEHRTEEIDKARKQGKAIWQPVIPVIPVRMQEAWLLFDEQAIRGAVGNPNGKMKLQLPSLKTIEGLSKPKEMLNDLLLEASGISGRRRSTVPVTKYAARVADYINDFTPLRQLDAFLYLEARIADLVQSDWPGTRTE